MHAAFAVPDAKARHFAYKGMFALVRFPNEVGNKLYVVSTRYIKDFEPSDDTDFVPNTAYQVFWDDPNKESTGFYSAQILMIAGMYGQFPLKIIAVDRFFDGA